MNFLDWLRKQSAHITDKNILRGPLTSKINFGLNEYIYDDPGQKDGINFVRRVTVSPDRNYYNREASTEEVQRYVTGTLTPDDVNAHGVRDTSYFKSPLPFFANPTWYRKGKIEGSHPEYDSHIFKRTNNQ